MVRRQLKPLLYLSSQTKTCPGEIARRSSASNRRDTIGNKFRNTAWNTVRASLGDLMRKFAQVGLCIAMRGGQLLTSGCQDLPL